MSEKEHIERGAVIKTLLSAIHSDGFGVQSNIDRHELQEDEIEDAVRSVPAADVEPVVRCKKCRYWEVIGTDEDEGFCKFRAGYTIESYYCADGKERER